MRDYITVGSVANDIKMSITTEQARLLKLQEHWEQAGMLREHLRILAILAAYLPTHEGENEHAEAKLKTVMAIMQEIQGLA